MSRWSGAHQMSDLDVAGVIRVHAEQRRAASEAGHAICGEFLGFASGRARVCVLRPAHRGPHT